MSTSMTVNDLEPPQIGGFSEFFAISGCNTHISTVNCAEMAGDRSRQPAYEIFSTECTGCGKKVDP